jgi:DNA uptake protein ComE-like DNA-binding protein
MRLNSANTAQRGSIFILVLWISFGLVVLSLYFANSMSFELKAADNRYAAVQAQQAINGAARYASSVVSTFATNGVVPEFQLYRSEWVPVGEASFWLLGQALDEQARSETIPTFGLVDEASKLNLNTATAEMLQWLPGMTAEFAAAIIDWRDTNADLSESGAEDENYQRLNPPRRCKNAPFESVDELRLVYGATLEMIYGEDSNRNGILDPNENDGDISLPLDNRDGNLDQGIAAYVTVHTRHTNTRADGSPRVNVGNRNNLNQLLTDTFGSGRAAEITGSLPNQFSSILHFYVESRMTAEEFVQIEDAITNSNQPVTQGLINVNTASEVVLSCLPGIGEAKAATLVAQRASNSSQMSSVAWVKDVLDTATIQQVGRFLTGRTYQFTADVVAVGRFNRGFRRTRFVIDSSEATPRVVYRQDLTPLGWALGLQIRKNLQTEMQARL